MKTPAPQEFLARDDGLDRDRPSILTGVFWDVQDYLPEDIDQIEVISGPGGTLWGANAVNGVINIATKRLEFSIVGQNLLHNHHPKYGFPGPTREEIEHSVYGKVAWRY